MDGIDIQIEVCVHAIIYGIMPYHFELLRSREESVSYFPSILLSLLSQQRTSYVASSTQIISPYSLNHLPHIIEWDVQGESKLTAFYYL